VTTARDLITKSLQGIGAISSGETPDAIEITDGLDALNFLMESLANEGLMVFSRTEENFPLTGAIQYTVGAGQDFDTVPFIQIISAYVRSGTIDYPLTSLSDQQYADIASKDTEGSTGEFYNYNNGFPIGVLKLYPRPSGTIYILSEKPITEFTLNTVISLPPGWKRMLVKLLGIEMAPDYNVSISPELADSAQKAKAVLLKQVSKSRTMDWPKRAYNFNIYSGYR